MSSINEDLEKISSLGELNYDSHPISQVRTTGPNDEFVMLGRMKVRKSELWSAFGGDLQPGVHAQPQRKFANPVPIGLCGFALTTLVLSMANARAMGIRTPNVAVAPAFFYGGFAQILAGMWEVALENTFGSVVLTSYGCFWLSWAAIEIDWFGIKAAYDDPIELENAIGFFLLGWVIFTFLILLCTMKSTVAFFSMFFLLEITFILLTVASFTRHVGCQRAGGVFGVITGFLAWYNAYAGIATKENSYFIPKPWPLPGATHF